MGRRIKGRGRCCRGPGTQRFVQGHQGVDCPGHIAIDKKPAIAFKTIIETIIETNIIIIRIKTAITIEAIINVRIETIINVRIETDIDNININNIIAVIINLDINLNNIINNVIINNIDNACLRVCFDADDRGVFFPV